MRRILISTLLGLVVASTIFTFGKIPVAAACSIPTGLIFNTGFLPPGELTVDKTGVIATVELNNYSGYTIIVQTSSALGQAQVNALSIAGPYIHAFYIGENPIPNGGAGFVKFVIPASYFDSQGVANLSPGAHPAAFWATIPFNAIGLTGCGTIDGYGGGSFKVIVGPTSTGPTSPGCIPRVTCSGAPPPVQTLPATMTLQSLTPGGTPEPSGTTKFGDKITATVTATSPSEPPPPPDAVSFAWTGPTTITRGSIGFPGIKLPEFYVPPTSATAFSGGGVTTPFSPQQPGTTNTTTTLTAQYGGPPADSYCYNCSWPNIPLQTVNGSTEPVPNSFAQFAGYGSPGEARIVFLEDFGGWSPQQPPGCAQGSTCKAWDPNGTWPVTTSLDVSRNGVFIIQWTTVACSGSGKSVTCWTVVHTAQENVTVQDDGIAHGAVTVTGSNRWELSTWEGGNGLP